MIKEVIAKNEERMKKTLSAAKSEFASLRAGQIGRASCRERV